MQEDELEGHTQNCHKSIFYLNSQAFPSSNLDAIVWPTIPVLSVLGPKALGPILAQTILNVTIAPSLDLRLFERKRSTWSAAIWKGEV